MPELIPIGGTITLAGMNFTVQAYRPNRQGVMVEVPGECLGPVGKAKPIEVIRPSGAVEAKTYAAASPTAAPTPIKPTFAQPFGEPEPKPAKAARSRRRSRPTRARPIIAPPTQQPVAWLPWLLVAVMAAILYGVFDQQGTADRHAAAAQAIRGGK